MPPRGYHRHLSDEDTGLHTGSIHAAIAVVFNIARRSED
jgi:hypothetical protein